MTVYKIHIIITMIQSRQSISQTLSLPTFCAAKPLSLSWGRPRLHLQPRPTQGQLGLGPTSLAAPRPRSAGRQGRADSRAVVVDVCTDSKHTSTSHPRERQKAHLLRHHPTEDRSPRPPPRTPRDIETPSIAVSAPES
jgi:hypothetical protein